ncbi:MAG: cytidylate kinase-like family protein [Eubacteriales bacterium]|nr:cytidylate kinase-like family protein [Eubacteriales bacterium]
MKNNVIITIARQFGSGGRLIGEKLAEKLDVPFYDKSIIHLASEESGIDEGLFSDADEKAYRNFWMAAACNNNIYGNRISLFNELPMNDKLFQIQSSIIKKLSSNGSCVIVGRCADYILKGVPHMVTVFIHSSEQDRLDRVIHTYGIPEKDARDVMMKTDKKRAAYYNYYSGEKWGRADTYDLSINSSTAGIDGCVDLIIKFAELKFEVLK